MFNSADAVQAYKRSAYQDAEYQIEGRIAGDSIPIFGGLTAGIKSVGNNLSRPFRVVGAFVFGHPAELSSVKEAVIPDDIKDNTYGKDIARTRDALHNKADRYGQGYGDMLSGEWSKGFRQFASARHEDAILRHTIMPEDSENQGSTLGALAGAALTAYAVGGNQPGSGLGSSAGSWGSRSTASSTRSGGPSI